MVVTADAETGDQNVGCYRMMYRSGTETGLMMQAFQGGAQHLSTWGRLHPGEPMPVAVVFGADPCYVLAGVRNSSNLPVRMPTPAVCDSKPSSW